MSVNNTVQAKTTFGVLLLCLKKGHQITCLPVTTSSSSGSVLSAWRKAVAATGQPLSHVISSRSSTTAEVPPCPETDIVVCSGKAQSVKRQGIEGGTQDCPSFIQWASKHGLRAQGLPGCSAAARRETQSGSSRGEADSVLAGSSSGIRSTRSCGACTIAMTIKTH